MSDAEVRDAERHADALARAGAPAEEIDAADEETERLHQAGSADDLARNRRLIARFRQAGAAGEADLHQEWVKFGEHNWVWQLLHRKPRAAS